MPFKKGKSGNPGGRPKEVAEIKALARQHGERAFKRIVELMRSKNDRTALAACQEVLDRGYGKPAQSVLVGDLPQQELVDYSDEALLAIVAQTTEVKRAAPRKKANKAPALH